MEITALLRKFPGNYRFVEEVHGNYRFVEEVS